MKTFEPNRLIRYDEESIINELRIIYSKFFNDKIMHKKDFDQYSKKIHSDTVSRYFGSWQNALIKASLPHGRNTRTPVEELKNELIRVKELRNNCYFSFNIYKRNGGRHNEKTILRGLGFSTWTDLLYKQFGIKREKKSILSPLIAPQKKEKYTQETLLNEIKNVWDYLGRRPTYKEFIKTAKIGIGVYERRFGNWTKAIEAFCLSHGNYSSSSIGKGFNATKELLIAELQKIKETHKIEVFEQLDYIKYGGKYSVQTFHNHFGSWKEALHSAGLKSGRDIPTREDFFDELQRIWEILGKQPSQKQMNSMSKFSIKQFLKINYNGKWMQCIYAFSKDRQIEDSNEITTENNISNSSDNIIENCSLQENKNDDNCSKNEAKKQIKTPRNPTLRQRFKVFQRDRFSCVVCGRSPAKDSSIILHVDHIKAYSKGGETELNNLQTLCMECNLGKSNLD